jgi:tetratricopeptide (TPR) repeat protein
MAKARSAIERVHSTHPSSILIDEAVLNWLGLHFLYWWGREDESIEVFELGASLYPGSWRALESLAEACDSRGRKDEAIRSHKRSLEINPENSSAKAALERLMSKAPG